MLIDSHCHLSDGRFREDLEETIKRAMEAGVEKIVVPATDLKDSRRVIDLTEKYEEVYGLVGIYPGNAEEIQDLRFTIQELRRLIQENKKIVGIGEIGMDGYWNKRNLGKQAEVFRAQLELAAELSKPVAIHSREAGGEIKKVLDGLQGSTLQGQFHCFGESEEFLDYVLGKGFYVSFCGNVTYPKRIFTSEESPPIRRAGIRTPSEEKCSLGDLAKRVPLDRLLLETDAPYLSPEGKRGERNEPANVRITAGFLAKIKGVNLEELAGKTTKNANDLFGI